MRTPHPHPHSLPLPTSTKKKIKFNPKPFALCPGPGWYVWEYVVLLSYGGEWEWGWGGGGGELLCTYVCYVWRLVYAFVYASSCSMGGNYLGFTMHMYILYVHVYLLGFNFRSVGVDCGMGPGWGMGCYPQITNKLPSPRPAHKK